MREYTFDSTTCEVACEICGESVFSAGMTKLHSVDGFKSVCLQCALTVFGRRALQEARDRQDN